ncbi:hypothetical protein HWV62_42574 [Athelia sp. TMB]|nr:hypothetical protein HWV62_42574 [Athelia sp. TMB]
MCSIGQLSPGAYFLRRNLFPSIIAFIKEKETGRFTFEAVLLLGVLANFHKFEAARLNPYLLQIKSFEDEEAMYKIAWAANFAANSVIKAYQDISDDSEPSLATAFGSFVTAFRADRVFANTANTPREMFKSHRDRPIEAVVVILPIFELFRLNSTFLVMLALSINQDDDQTSKRLPLPLTLISLASYLLTHASSVSSPRATARDPPMPSDYDWAELWRAIIGLLTFVSHKVDNLITTGSVAKLAADMSDILRKQQIVLQAARATSNRRSSWQPDEVVKALNHLILVTDHYAKLVAGADSRSAKQAIKLVARSIENDGLYLGPGEHLEFEEPLIPSLFASTSASLKKRCATRGFASAKAPSSLFGALDTFSQRHIGPDDHEASHMLSTLGYDSMDAFVNAAVPPKIRVATTEISNASIPSFSESELYYRAKELGSLNKVFKSYIGLGYHNAVVPPVILRNVMENPAWYTPYTPYQPEIAQGRLESLVNYQTMVMSLTFMDIANASLLDEATAAAEGMVMAYVNSGQKKKTFLVDTGVFPQTLSKKKTFLVDTGVFPQTLSVLRTRAKGFGIQLVVGDVSTAMTDDTLRSDLCGVMVQYPDVNGSIKDYSQLAKSVHDAGGLVVCATDLLALTMLKPPGEWGADIVLGNSARFGVPAGYGGPHAAFFAVTDKLKRKMPGRLIGRSRDTTGKIAYRLALQTLANVFTAAASAAPVTTQEVPAPESVSISPEMWRTSEYLNHPVFNQHHSETEMLRYIFHLASKDLGLVHAMIPLGSCTMKLNSTSSMIPLTWPEFSATHPFAPVDQVQGYLKMLKELEDDLCRITGFHACSLQPNSGAAGEYAGLTVIRAYHESRGESHRNICLIPLSAHGTNPASAVMAGLKVVPVKTHHDGNLDLEDLRAKAEKHKDNLAAFMITYPSTFGVFEEGVTEKMYPDMYLGANLNAQIGLTNPATCGGDVCHMNLHKTFAIPHGGGGPGVGPICVAEHLSPFLPGHSLVPTGGDQAIDAVSAAPFGSASICLISWAYIKMLGGQGLKDSSQLALLNANYMAHRLSGHYSLRFKNGNDRVAHELLIDLAEFDKSAGLKVTDFAKRLQDYGFHPPTCSWPISTCMLIEPTESETLEEIDRFCNAMIQIRREAEDIITGKQPKDNNLLKNAPHPASIIALSEAEWNRPYSRQTAAYPMPGLLERKFWPTVSRIDDAYGDLNLICDCPTVEELAS